MLDDFNLLNCLVACILVTVLPKVLPITFIKGEELPLFLRQWLDFVPVAVMAALVGSELFFYDGEFNLSLSNLFLVASQPLIVIAYYTRNYFLTIAVGLALVIIARYFKWYS